MFIESSSNKFISDIQNKILQVTLKACLLAISGTQTIYLRGSGWKKYRSPTIKSSRYKCRAKTLLHFRELHWEHNLPNIGHVQFIAL